MPFKRSSGLDFSDGRGSIGALDQHPDIQHKAGSSQMQRNKSERRRLQGLQRTLTATSRPSFPDKPNTFMQKFDLWMINEGGRQLFFGVWIFLHFLVAIFGFFHYQLKDNFTQARAIFGITYGAYPHLIA
jgi:NADPH oxidase